MSGYHRIPHEISQYDYKQWRRLSKTGKMSIASIWSMLCNDYYMRNEVSYRYYEKRTGWDKKLIKKFLNHIGLNIDTKPNIKKMNKLKLCEPIKKDEFPDNIVGIFKENFSPETSPEEHQKNDLKTDSYKKSSPEVPQKLPQKSTRKTI